MYKCDNCGEVVPANKRNYHVKKKHPNALGKVTFREVKKK